jgi:hypothetical protein
MLKSQQLSQGHTQSQLRVLCADGEEFSHQVCKVRKGCSDFGQIMYHVLDAEQNLFVVLAILVLVLHHVDMVPVN